MNKLSFETLRSANIARLPLFKNKHGEPAHSKPDGSDWTISDWTEAVLGELGEFANCHKKFRRGDIDRDEFEREARKELADVQVYLDILAFQLKIDLGDAVTDKFNEISERIKCGVRIHDNGEHFTSGVFVESINERAKRLIKNTCTDFYGFMQEVMPEVWPDKTTRVELDLNSLIDKFKLAYPGYGEGSWFKRKKFEAWLYEYAKFVECSAGCGNSNGKRIFYLIKH